MAWHRQRSIRSVSLNDITLAQLRALLAVQRHGSITSAASALRVTQPVLTRALRLLEQHFGVELLQRSARGASLTAYGEALVQRALSIEEEVRRARDELQQMQGKLLGRVALACSPIPMMLFVPAAIGHFRRSFTDVEVRVTEAVYPDVMAEFKQARIDFAIGPIPDRGLGREYKTSKLLDTELVVAARRGHRKARAKLLADLLEEDWMVMGPPDGPGAIVSQVFERHGLPAPATPLFLNSVWSALEVIGHTDLMGIIPRPVAQWASRDISIVPVSETLPVIRIHAISPSKTILTPAARALLSAIRASAASHAGEPSRKQPRDAA
jgi:LysR family transcriptional regulator, regulator of abg operon